MNNSLRRLALAAALFALFACSGKEAVQQSESNAVPRLHELYDAENFDRIYADAHEKFRETTPKADYDKFMASVRRKLGRVKSTKREGWNVNVGTGGTRVVLTYTTEFERGKGTETFTFLNAGGHPKLLGYHINSNTLVVN